MQTQQYIGQPSSFAHANVIFDPALQFGVAYAVSGKESSEVVKKIQQKLQHPEVDSFASFLSLIRRVEEQWTGLFAELSAIHILEGKALLVAQNGEIWLMRQGKFGRVLKASEELKVLEGAALVGDQYYCLTQSAVVALMTHYPALFESTTFSLSEPQLVSILEQSGLSDRSAAFSVEVATPATVPIQRRIPSVVSGEKIHQWKLQIKKLLKKVAGLPKFFSDMTALVRANPTVRKRMMVGGGVLAVLIIGIISIAALRSFEIQRVQAELDLFRTQLTTIQASSDADVIAARDAMLKLSQEFETAKTSTLSTQFGASQVAEFEKVLTQAVVDLSGKVDLQTLPVFFDFGLVKPGFVASAAELGSNRGVFLDREKQQLTSVTFADKQLADIPIGQYPQLTDVASFNEQLYLLADGIYEFTAGSGAAPKKIINEGDSNKAATLITAYETFIYVFNPEKRNIYRYSLTGDEEAPAPIGWLQDKSDLDFEQVSSMAVDGTLWMTTTDGQVLKYERGSKAPFTITGLSDPFSGSLTVATHPNADSVFVLDTDKKRVVRLSKEGVFLQEFRSPQLAAASDLIFSPDNQTVYVSAGSLIYEIKIQ